MRICCRFRGPVAGVSVANILSRIRWGVVLMFAPEYKVDVTTHNGVMAILPVYVICPYDLDIWPAYTKPGPNTEDMCLFWSLYNFSFLIYWIIKCRFRCPISRQRTLPWQPFCAPLVGGGHYVSFVVWIWYDHAILGYCKFYPETLRDVMTMSFGHSTWTGYDLLFQS